MKCLKRYKSGILTVEASVLMAIAFLVVVLLLMYCFYQHGYVFYSAAAYEAALEGNSVFSNVSKGEEKAKVRAQQRIEDQTLPGTSPKMEVSSDDTQTKVGFSEQTYALFSKFFKWKVDVAVEKVRPSKVLRLRWNLKGLVE